MPQNLFSINDPIHGLMQFSKEQADLVKKIIKASEFQRLRYIKQLGMAFYIYPGATHNRLSHAFGVAYLAKRVIEKLLRDSQDKDLNDAINSAIALGLLHDIGHGPYSHMFERIQYNGKFKFKHEDITKLIIERLSSRPGQDRDLLNEILKIIKSRKSQENAFEIKKNIVNSIISSQLDVDRMDYLLRDSHFCGVDYGNYDKKWLMHGFQYCKENNKTIIGVNRKAIGVIEHYLMARRLMTNCVYKHPKVVATEYWLGCFIDDIYSNLEIFLKKNIYKNLLLVKYLSSVKLHDNFNQIVLDDYLAIADMDVEVFLKIISMQNEHLDKDFKKIADRIYTREFPIVEEIDYSRIDEADHIIQEFSKGHPDIMKWQLHLDLRKFSTYGDKEKYKDEKIFIIDSNKNITSIDTVSLPIFSLTNKEEINPILIIDKSIYDSPSVKWLRKELQRKGCFVVHGVDIA